MNPFDLLLIALATLYVSHVLTHTEGPFFAFRWLRDRTRRPFNLFPFALLDCIWCTVVWVAGVMLFIYFVYPLIVWLFAIAGAAMMIWTYTGMKHG